MEWEEYKLQKKDSFKLKGINEWVGTDIRCPKCGSMVFKNIGTVLSCYPAKYKYGCVSCDWTDVWY